MNNIDILETIADAIRAHYRTLGVKGYNVFTHNNAWNCQVGTVLGPGQPKAVALLDRNSRRWFLDVPKGSDGNYKYNPDTRRYVKVDPPVRISRFHLNWHKVDCEYLVEVMVWHAVGVDQQIDPERLA